MATILLIRALQIGRVLKTIDNIEEKRKKINRYLRHHTDIKIEINLCDVYACISVRIFRKDVLVGIDWGDTLEHRLDFILTWIESQEYIRNGCDTKSN
jgi:hypothetical protein